MKTLNALTVLLSLALLVLPNLAAPTVASPFIGGTDAWTLVNSPSVSQVGCCAAGQVVYHNNINVTVLGIVFMVLHNDMGQTVYFTSATLDIAAGANSTAYEVIFGLPSGNYDATFFAIAPSGVAISAATTATLTLP
jgi:hypothetical protein